MALVPSEVGVALRRRRCRYRADARYRTGYGALSAGSGHRYAGFSALNWSSLIQRLVPLGMAAFAVVYLVAAWNIALDPWSAAETVNARALPIVYGIGLLAVSIALLAVAPPPRNAREGARWTTLGAHCVAITAFGLLIPYAGLWLATALLLLAGLLIAGERRLVVLTVAPLATAATAWFLIAVVLDIYVDPGVWFD